jgi:hypothetical protein
MPTIKPRVQVTLEPETHAVIERLASLQGRTRGAVIAEMLDSVAPALTRTISLIEAAQDAPGQVRAGMRRAVESAHAEIVSLAGDASKQLDVFLDSLGSQEQANPHVVTRGSGITDTTQKHKNTKARKGSSTGGTANG